MKRYRWTARTMEVTDLGGAYVTHADHLRAMAELEERLKSAMAERDLLVGCSNCGATLDLSKMKRPVIQQHTLYKCRICKDTGCPDCY